LGRIDSEHSADQMMSFSKGMNVMEWIVSMIDPSIEFLIRIAFVGEVAD
jgi:hypothetical protein